MKKAILILLIFSSFKLTAQVDTPYKKTASYINNYGDSVDQATQNRGYYQQYPICFIGFKLMWLNDFCDNNVLRNSAYTKLDVDKLTPPVSTWTVTQNIAFNRLLKVVVKATIDKNNRMKKVVITGSEQIIIQLFVFYWNVNNLQYEDVASGKIASQTYLSDKISLVRNKGKLQIEITPGLLNIPHNN